MSLGFFADKAPYAQVTCKGVRCMARGTWQSVSISIAMHHRALPQLSE